MTPCKKTLNFDDTYIMICLRIMSAWIYRGRVLFFLHDLQLRALLDRRFYSREGFTWGNTVSKSCTKWTWLCFDILDNICLQLVLIVNHCYILDQVTYLIIINYSNLSNFTYQSKVLSVLIMDYRMAVLFFLLGHSNCAQSIQCNKGRKL